MAQPIFYVRVAAATLIVSLILGSFVGIPRVAAASASIERSIDAGAARYQTLGETYLAKAEAGRMRGIDADAARYQILGETYLAKAEAGRMRGIDTDSARWDALGKSYAQGSASLPYADVAKFYVERMRVQARQRAELAANPELVLARRAYVVQSELAANPELIVARRSYGQGYLVCTVGGC